MVISHLFLNICDPTKMILQFDDCVFVLVFIELVVSICFESVKRKKTPVLWCFTCLLFFLICGGSLWRSNQLCWQNHDVDTKVD